MQVLKETIHSWVKEMGIELFGVASAELANEKAPETYTPEAHLKNSQAVVMFAMRMPAGALNTMPDGKLQEIYYMRAFWTSSHFMDTVSYKIALLIEKESGYKSMPIPTYGPMRIVGGVPRGLVSLKHMAQLAGIGSMGRNSILVHPKHGNLLRLGGVITQAPMLSDAPAMDDPCPKGCEACVKACPVDAILDRSVDIITCMGQSIRHPLMRPYAMTRFLLWLSKSFQWAHRFVEDLTNMIIVDYSESCTRCLRACPYYKTSIKWIEQNRKGQV
jgi:epoxyqueuosine reductase QueG